MRSPKLFFFIFILLPVIFTSFIIPGSAKTNKLSVVDLSLELEQSPENLQYNLSEFELLTFSPTRVGDLKNGKYQLSCDAKFRITITFAVNQSLEYALSDPKEFKTQIAKFAHFANGPWVADYNYYDVLPYYTITELKPAELSGLFAASLTINEKDLIIESEYFNSTTSTMRSTIRQSSLTEYQIETSESVIDLLPDNKRNPTRTVTKYVGGFWSGSLQTGFTFHDGYSSEDYISYCAKNSHAQFMHESHAGLTLATQNSILRSKGLVDVQQIEKTNNSIKLNLEFSPRIQENQEMWRSAYREFLYYEEWDQGQSCANPIPSSYVCKQTGSAEQTVGTRAISLTLTNYIVKCNLEIDASLFAIANIKTNDTYTLDSLNNQFWTSLLTGNNAGMVHAAGSPNPNGELLFIDGYSVFYLIMTGMFVFYFLLFKAKKHYQVN